MQDGYIFNATCLCIPSASPLEYIVWEMHAAGFVGHLGPDKVIAMLEDIFYWLVVFPGR